MLASVRIPVESITHSGLKPITESERWMGPDCATATTRQRDMAALLEVGMTVRRIESDSGLGSG